MVSVNQNNSKRHREYPFFGRISRCPDRDYGFLIGPTGEEWVHIRDHVGRHLTSMEGLERQPCAFVIGGNPFQHSMHKHKSGWDAKIVQWRILDDTDPPLSPQTYMEERARGLLTLDNKQLQFARRASQCRLKPKHFL
jgi:hypothetical protein